jgi:hypothetical protein
MGYSHIGKFDAQRAEPFMRSCWKDLYRTTISDHRSTLALLTQAIQAAEACSSPVLKAQLRTHRVMPVLLLCQELDRFEVPAPEIDSGRPHL